MSKSVKCINQCSTIIQVSLSKYGRGKDEFCTIAPDGMESWERSDERGFAMAFLIDNKLYGSALVYAGKEYYLSNSNGKISLCDEDDKDVKISEPVDRNAIKCVNMSKTTIEVSLSKYGSGNDDYYAIAPEGGTESWQRTDERGHIMAIRVGNNFVGSYLVFPSQKYEFK